MLLYSVEIVVWVSRVNGDCIWRFYHLANAFHQTRMTFTEIYLNLIGVFSFTRKIY